MHCITAALHHKTATQKVFHIEKSRIVEMRPWTHLANASRQCTLQSTWHVWKWTMWLFLGVAVGSFLGVRLTRARRLTDRQRPVPNSEVASGNSQSFLTEFCQFWEPMNAYRMQALEVVASNSAPAAWSAMVSCRQKHARCLKKSDSYSHSNSECSFSYLDGRNPAPPGTYKTNL